ncbi:MAG: hypothetical protein WDO73_15905 [Ignavibacteriota bacterium]
MEVLEAYQAGMEQARERTVVGGKKHWWMAGWWPAKAAWQTALAVVLLVGGGFAGHYLARPSDAKPEISQLRAQVESLRQTVALSMLRDQSSSSRISRRRLRQPGAAAR